MSARCGRVNHFQSPFPAHLPRATGFRSLPNEFIFFSVFFNTQHCEQFHLETFFPSRIAATASSSGRQKTGTKSRNYLEGISCLTVCLRRTLFIIIIIIIILLLFLFKFFPSLTRTRATLSKTLAKSLGYLFLAPS